MEGDSSTIWLTLSEVVKHTKCSRWTIYKYVQLHKIPFYKVPHSSRLRFNKAEIDNWLKSGKQMSPDEYRASLAS